MPGFSLCGWGGGDCSYGISAVFANGTTLPFPIREAMLIVCASREGTEGALERKRPELSGAPSVTEVVGLDFAV